MQPAQIILILFALAAVVGGVVMLVKGAGRETTVTPRPYIPMGVVAVGLIVAYQAVTSYERLDPSDITLLFLFVFVLALLVGLRFFVIDRYEVSQVEQPRAGSGVENAKAADEESARVDEEPNV